MTSSANATLAIATIKPNADSVRIAISRTLAMLSFRSTAATEVSHPRLPYQIKSQLYRDLARMAMKLSGSVRNPQLGIFAPESS